MPANIFSALEQLGLTAQKRAIHVQFSNGKLSSKVFLQRVDGQHAINSGVNLELICLSTDALIPLKEFIGSQVAVDQVTDQGQLFRTTGIVTEALQGQSDGSLTLYKLKVQDATALWHKRRNSRVFMNKSVTDIVETLFSEWQSKSQLFALGLSLDLSGLEQQYDVRPFTMQSNETDYEFITRLLRSEGINWLIDEAELQVPSSSSSIQAQKLRLIDDNSQYQGLMRGAIRFHRSSATEKYDSITSFIGHRSIQPTAVHVQRWQADSLEQDEGAGSVLSKHKHSDMIANASLALEQSWHFTPAWMQDLNGEDGATKSSNSQVEKFNQNLGHFYDGLSKQFVANSTVRDTQVGYWFEFNEHPEVDQHSGADKEFLIVSKDFYNQNNLPKDLTDQITQLLQQSGWSNAIANQGDERQANRLMLQRKNIKIVPEFNPLQHRPTAHPQRAKVVGPPGEEIHVDEWGRIKVRFMFTRGEDHQHDGGAGTNLNDTDSAWVDVLTPWAGEGYGARFLPRIDEIVVIDFFDGNIDRPFVVGRLHEAHRSPTKFDKKGQLPDTKRISGIRSKEVEGGGFNQLRFDDTTGQISAQLQSSHGASQLNLGNLSYPKAAAESDGRGEGFELRTDQWGAIRAGEGLLLTTYPQSLAKDEHFKAEEAREQLEKNYLISKDLSDVAKKQQANALESYDQLKNFAEQIENDIARFKKAIMLLTSPESIAISTPRDIHLSSSGQISQVANESINLSTQKNLIGQALGKVSLFAAHSGVSAIAAKGKLELQAQDDALDVLAKSGITISSSADQIQISSPKEIVITGGSSQIKINGSGIFPTTGGKFEVKAGQHVFQPGQSATAATKIPKPNPLKGALDLFRSYGEQDYFKNTAYKVIDAVGKEVSGTLDGNGFAAVTGIAPGPAKVIFEKDERSAWSPASHFDTRSYQWSGGFASSQGSGGGLAGMLGGMLGAAGENLMGQLKDNLFNLNSDSLKNMGQNLLNDMGGKALNQLTNQVGGGILGGIADQLNLGLSAEQLMNIGQQAKNAYDTVEAIQEQGLDFFKDQASAMLSQSLGNALDSLAAPTGYVGGFAGQNSGQSYMPWGAGSKQTQSGSLSNYSHGYLPAGSYEHVPEPTVVDDDFISQKVFSSSSGGLTITETVRMGSGTEVESPLVAQQQVEPPPPPRITTPPLEDPQPRPTSPPRADEPVVVHDSFLSQKYYQEGNVNYTETVRVATKDNLDRLQAKK